jgi:crotonobetainyl-CoA:carnitine CoA-transferase CaiB-like acyl-CoA transferase
LTRRASRVRPLAGVRIVTLAQNVPGPVAVARLVGEGAAATKIEPPARDPLHTLCRAWYLRLHKGVQVERVDLKTAGGQARLHRLLRHADLLITSQRPSALGRLGIEARSLAKQHPRLRWLNIVGDTREVERPGHDLTYLADVGLIVSDMPRTLIADLLGAERAVSTALLLLRQPAPRTAQVGLRDVLEFAATPLKLGLTSAGGPLGGALPTYRLYATREGSVAVGALEQHFVARLYAALHLPPGADLTAIMRTRTSRQWERWAMTRDLPLARIK